MRRMLGFLAVLALATAWSSDARAQSGGYNDPFFLYYGYFLPRQAALANQPQVEDTINAAVASQQVYAQTNRSSLYDPNGGYGASDPFAYTDPLDPRSRGGAARGAPTGGGGAGARRTRGSVPSTNIAGNGPALYYNRTAAYYPNNTRPGHGPNKNVAVPGRGVRRGGGGGMGVPSMPSMPGVGPR